MPESSADLPRDFPPAATTEHAFRIDRMRPVGPGADDGVVGAMTTGSWSRRGTVPSSGVLAVLLDAVLARASLLGTGPDRRWLTSELSVDLCAPLSDSAVITATGRRMHVGAVETVAEARAHAGDALVAIATTRGRVLAAADRPALGEPRLIDNLDDLVLATDEPEVLRIHPHPGVTNQQGLLHGGVTACVAQIAAQEAFGGRTALEASALRVVYLRPLPVGDGPVTVRTRVEHRGRSLGLAHVELVRPDGRVGAVATVSGAA